MTRPTKAGDRGKTSDRGQPDDKTVRCPATEGAQQCLSATHHHLQNHRWGPRGETDQWNADGTPKIPEPAEGHHSGPLPHENSATGTTLVTETADDATEQLPRDPATAGEDGGEWFNGDNKAAEPQRGNTDQAREWLANQPPTGPLLGDVQEQARSQGLVKPKGADEADRADMDRLGATHPDIERPTIRPDAGESVLGAAMGIINPAADPGYAITHAEESARVLIVGQHVGHMFQSIADKMLVEPDDVVAVYRKMRQIAATHGIDLDAQDGGS